MILLIAKFSIILSTEKVAVEELYTEISHIARKKPMKMNSSCVAGCLDDNAEVPPVKVSSFMKLYKWPESDAEFLIRKVNMEEEEEESTAIRFPLNLGRSPVYHYHESFASRQRYLRSYTFSRKETVGEKTKRWLKRNEKVAVKAESVQRCRRGYCRFVQIVHKLLGSLCRRRL